MIPRSMIASKARPPTVCGISISNALWSLDAYSRGNRSMK
jgi:hypothetical protein